VHHCSKFRRERKECEWCDIGPFRQREVENILLASTVAENGLVGSEK